MRKEIIEECVGKLKKFLIEYEELEIVTVEYNNEKHYERFLVTITNEYKDDTTLTDHIEASDGHMIVEFAEPVEVLYDGYIDTYSMIRRIVQTAFAYDQNLTYRESGWEGYADPKEYWEKEFKKLEEDWNELIDE